jgi:sulfate permease, SulP family
MVVGVMVGIVLAALLLVRRVAQLASTRIFEGGIHPALKEPLPQRTLLYEIAGPFLFGAAQRAVNAILNRRAPMEQLKVVIFDMTSIPTMDITGLIALETTIKGLTAKETRVLLVGVQGQPRDLIERAHLVGPATGVSLHDTLDEAVERAKVIVGPPGPDHLLSQSGRWRRIQDVPGGPAVKAAAAPPGSSRAP